MVPAFQYFNGVDQVYGDLMEIEEGLHFHLNGDPNGIVDLMESSDPGVAYPATRKMVAAVREVMGMVPYDKTTDTGAKWQHCLDAWNVFIAYKKLLKKSTEPSPTSDADGVEN